MQCDSCDNTNAQLMPDDRFLCPDCAKNLTLAHAKATERLVSQGKREQAGKLHNAHVEAQFNKAKNGEVIDLTSLMAGKEQLR